MNSLEKAGLIRYTINRRQIGNEMQIHANKDFSSITIVDNELLSTYQQIGRVTEHDLIYQHCHSFTKFQVEMFHRDIDMTGQYVKHLGNGILHVKLRKHTWFGRQLIAGAKKLLGTLKKK